MRMKQTRRLAAFAAALLLICAMPVKAAAVYDESEQWNLSLIGADAAFALGCLGQGVRVGVLDSGINPHEDFGVRLLPGHNYMEGAKDEADTTDRLGHGTAVAGLIAGAGEHGYIGVAPAAELVPLKVTDGENVKISTICRAIYGGVDDFGCNVLNLSLGVTGEHESLKEAIDYAVSKGVTVVAAVGNDGSTAVYYPAGYDNVIGVGAVTRYGGVYSLTNCNSTVCLTAPGAGVRSTAANGGYQVNDGTSFAVPQVAGAVAVLLGIDPTLTPEQIMDLMAQTATDRGAEGYDEYYGYGILNLEGCVEALTGKTAEPYAPEPIAGYADCRRDASCVMAAYTDLDCGAWYHDGVHFALQTGIMNGISESLFAPASPASRAMIVTMLWRMEGEPESDGALTFADVPEGVWYTEAVRWAASEGIVDGYSTLAFGPNDHVSREQLATILWRYARYKGTNTAPASKVNLGVFIDAEHISRWAYDGMQWAVNTGLISGAGNEKLSPETDASRAQVATIMMRYCTMSTE